MLVILICFFRIVVFIRYDYLVFFSDEACTKRVEGTIEKCVAPRTPPRPRAAPATASVRRALHTLRLGRACAFPNAAAITAVNAIETFLLHKHIQQLPQLACLGLGNI